MVTSPGITSDPMGKKETWGKSPSSQQHTAVLNLSFSYLETFCIREACGLTVYKASPCLKPHSRRKDKKTSTNDEHHANYLAREVLLSFPLSKPHMAHKANSSNLRETLRTPFIPGGPDSASWLSILGLPFT